MNNGQIVTYNNTCRPPFSYLQIIKETITKFSHRKHGPALSHLYMNPQKKGKKKPKFEFMFLIKREIVTFINEIDGKRYNNISNMLLLIKK